MSQQPIGIFDSGVGGLSILKAIQHHLPNENLLYFADSKYAPYGKLDQKILHERCRFIAQFFVEKNAKALVIACNTATAVMADWLRAEFDLPIIALEPAIKPAAEITKTNNIGVFATENTLHSERYLSLLQKYAKDKKVFESSCAGFVEQVELGELATPKTLSLIENYLNPMLEQNIDVLVLGCTHYPFLEQSIRKIAGEHQLEILDTADAVSLQLTRVLAEHELLNFDGHHQDLFFTSSQLQQAKPVFSKLLNTDITVVEVS
ncbi:MAG: glutamate racemase [Kangiellaceae bacterium]|nr:glutamate racemase [Kangiellaceae bacterium]